MNLVRLANDGILWLKERPLTDDPLLCLGFVVELTPACTLRSFFRMLERHEVLQRLNPFTPSFLAQYRKSPPGDGILPGLEALELARRVEMTGHPGFPCMRVFISLEGIGGHGPESIKTAGIDQLLDLPLRLGRLKHTVFGDQVDTLSFDTVFTLFDLIDGICWELSFHNLPDRCRI